MPNPLPPYAYLPTSVKAFAGQTSHFFRILFISHRINQYFEIVMNKTKVELESYLKVFACIWSEERRDEWMNESLWNEVSIIGWLTRVWVAGHSVTNATFCKWSSLSALTYNIIYHLPCAQHNFQDCRAHYPFKGQSRKFRDNCKLCLWHTIIIHNL